MSLHLGGDAADCVSCGKQAKHAPMTSDRYTVWCDTLACPIVSRDGPGAWEKALAAWNAREAGR